MELTQDSDNSRIFYGGSAFFAVLSVLYLGFEYLQDLSPVTISALIFSVFLAAFLRGTFKEKRMKFVYYLTAAGSYIVFLLYVNGKFLETSNQVLISLIASAGLFLGIGYLLTEKEKFIPDRERANKLTAAITVFIGLLLLYNVFFVQASFTADLDDTAVLDSERQMIGEIRMEKTGYLPIETDRRSINFCTVAEGLYLPTSYQSFGGETTSFGPYTATENITLEIRERFFEDNRSQGLERGLEMKINVVESCQSSDISQGELGVDLGGDWLLEDSM